MLNHGINYEIVHLIGVGIVFFASTARAAGVKLERLEDFDIKQHRISVNVEVEIKGGCLVDRPELEKTFTGLLSVFGFTRVLGR